MSTREIRDLEFQYCMEEVKINNALFQAGYRYDREDQTPYSSWYQNPVVDGHCFALAPTPTAPVKAYASILQSGGLLPSEMVTTHYVDEQGGVYGAGWSFIQIDGIETPFWGQYFMRALADGVLPAQYDPDDPSTYVDIIAADIIYTTPTDRNIHNYPYQALVIDIDGYPWMVYCGDLGGHPKFAEKFTFTPGHPHVAVYTMGTTWYHSREDGLMYGWVSTGLQYTGYWEVCAHPTGKEWKKIVSGSVYIMDSNHTLLTYHSQNQFLGIDEEGRLFALGVSSGGVLGLPERVGGNTYTLTEWADVYEFWETNYNNIGTEYWRPPNFTSPLVDVFIQLQEGSYVIDSFGNAYSAGQAVEDMPHPLARSWTSLESHAYNTNEKHCRIAGRWRFFSIGKDTMLGIAKDGTLWGSGDWKKSQLGCTFCSYPYTSYDEAYSDKPYPISTDTDFLHCSIYSYQSNAIKTGEGLDGGDTTKVLSARIYSEYGMGQVGTNPGCSGLPFIDPDRTWIDMAIGNRFVMLVSPGGYIWIGGDNLNEEGEFGSLPGFNPTDDHEMYIIPFQGGNVEKVWAGYHWSAVRTKDGKLYLSGSRIPKPDSSGLFAYTEYPFPSKVVDVRYTDGDTYYGMGVLLENGQIFVWGNNTNYALGVANGEAYIPDPVALPGRYTAFDLSDNHGGAIAIDGSLRMWGTDSTAANHGNQNAPWGLFGQLGEIGGACTATDHGSAVTVSPKVFQTPTLITTLTPSHFIDICCTHNATIVVVGKTAPGENPEYRKGDLWGTGSDCPALGDFYMYNQQGMEYINTGCWRPIRHAYTDADTMPPYDNRIGVKKIEKATCGIQAEEVSSPVLIASLTDGTVIFWGSYVEDAAAEPFLNWEFNPGCVSGVVKPVAGGGGTVNITPATGFLFSVIGFGGVGIHTPGQLVGYGENTYLVANPIEPTNAPAIYNYDPGVFRDIEMGIGGDFAAAITVDGNLVCWGNNAYGQCGVGGAFGGYGTFSEDNGNFVDVACGANHVLVLSKNGKIYGRGDNQYGQLGLDSNISFINELTEIPAPLGNVWSQIRCGENHSFLLTVEGVGFVSGRNHKGQLGKGDTVDRYEFTDFAHGTLWSTIDGGSEHSAGIDVNGLLYTWGDNTYGQLGIGSFGGVFSSPQQIPFDFKFYDPNWTEFADVLGQVACGGFHTAVAGQENGSGGSFYQYYVYATGRNDKGQCMRTVGNHHTFGFCSEYDPGGDNILSTAQAPFRVYCGNDNIAAIYDYNHPKVGGWNNMAQTSWNEYTYGGNTGVVGWVDPEKANSDAYKFAMGRTNLFFLHGREW